MTARPTTPSAGTGTGSTSGLSTDHRQAHWAGVVSLGLGVFAIVMSEFLPASLLPRMAQDLHSSAGAAGQSVTTTAVAAAVSALSISLVLPWADRRRVVLGLSALAVVSDVAVALAPNLPVVLAARVLLGVALGGFWAMATAMAAHLVPADHLGRALTVVNSGVAVATVAAVPLGSWLGEVWGWRGVFLLGGGVALVALVVQAATLPRVPSPGTRGSRALGATLRSGVVLVGSVAILLVYSGHFSGFTYVRPAVDDLAGSGAGELALLLLIFGIANFLGTAVSGPLADRALRVSLLAFPMLLGIGMLALFWLGGSTVGLFTATAVWGSGFGGMPTSVLTWGARAQPNRLEQIGGVIVTVCSAAIAVGASVGGFLVDRVDATAPLVAGGVAAIVGAAVLAGVGRRR